MASVGLDCIIVRPVIANGGTDTSAFSVPRGAKSMTVIAPGTLPETITIQTFIPDDTLTGANQWNTVGTMLDAGTALATTLGPTAGQALVYDYKFFGGGALRLHAGGAVGAARQFYILFHVEK